MVSFSNQKLGRLNDVSPHPRHVSLGILSKYQDKFPLESSADASFASEALDLLMSWSDRAGIGR